jgi:DNA-binding beta-propeller fold protein YncE
MKRFLWLGFVLFLYVICTGCGDTFRPIIIPNPPTFPNPAAAHSVLSINDNGTIVPGTAMVIDVSGDSDVSVANVGLAPVHAVQQSANQVLVVNHSVTGALQDSITKLDFSGTVIGSTSTISLPLNSAPNFVATTEGSQAYVLLPNLTEVEVVNTNSNSLVAAIPVGNNPVAMAETPDTQKLYVANQDDSTISGFNTEDRSSRTVSGSFHAPLWVIARSDSQRLYVLNGNGVVSTVDTHTTTGPDNVIDASVNAPGAAYMLYDGNTNRLYIPGGSQLTMLDVSQSVPVVLTGGPITIPTVQPTSRGAGDPCSGTSTAALNTVAVTALPDGSRAYVGAYYEDAAHNICPQVTVIDVPSNTIKSYFAVPGFPAYDAFCSATRFRFMMAAGGDSSRAYLASCDGGMVNVIDTSSDTYILNLPAPISSRTVQGSQQNPPQNPVFLIAGP